MQNTQVQGLQWTLFLVHTSYSSQYYVGVAPGEFNCHLWRASVYVREAMLSIAGKRRHEASLQVALLGQPDTAVNRERLADLLAVQGEFPSKYRPLIWEFLLQLPRNSAAYQVTPFVALSGTSMTSACYLRS